MLKNPFAFDESGFQFQKEQEGVLIWLTPSGDKLALFHFEIAPDIEADLDDNESLRAFYRANAHRAGLGVWFAKTPASFVINDIATVVSTSVLV